MEAPQARAPDEHPLLQRPERGDAAAERREQPPQATRGQFPPPRHGPAQRSQCGAVAARPRPRRLAERADEARSVGVAPAAGARGAAESPPRALDRRVEPPVGAGVRVVTGPLSDADVSPDDVGAEGLGSVGFGTAGTGTLGVGSDGVGTDGTGTLGVGTDGTGTLGVGIGSGGTGIGVGSGGGRLGVGTGGSWAAAPGTTATGSAIATKLTASSPCQRSHFPPTRLPRFAHAGNPRGYLVRTVIPTAALVVTAPALSVALARS